MLNGTYDAPKLKRTFVLNRQYFWVRLPTDAGLAASGQAVRGPN